MGSFLIYEIFRCNQYIYFLVIRTSNSGKKHPNKASIPMHKECIWQRYISLYIDAVINLISPISIVLIVVAMSSRESLYNHASAIKMLIMVSLLLSLFSSLSLATSVGVIPTEMDLGTYSRGDTIEASIYLSTSSDSEFRLSSSYIRPVADPWFNEHISEYSEQDISRWLDFGTETFEMDGTESFNVRIGDTRTRANKEVRFYVNIPEDAEPGYHSGSISFNPAKSDGVGPQVNLFSITRPNFIFRVSGDVIRSADIVSMRAERRADDHARIYLEVRNTGTNTISTDSTESLAKIYNDNDEIRAELRINRFSISPGETRPVAIDWYSKETIEDGRYKVSANIDYRSDEMQKTEFVTVPSAMTTPQADSGLLDLDDTVSAIPVSGKCLLDLRSVVIVALLVSMLLFARSEQSDIKTAAVSFVSAAIAIYLLNWLVCMIGVVWILSLLVLLAIAYYIRKE